MGEARGSGGGLELVRLEEVAYDSRGLVPVVAQDAVSGEVLMVAYANREALELTVASGQAHYWSRSRNSLWRKGATSGNVQAVRRVLVDCDADTVLYLVETSGPACHTGERSCFFREVPSARKDLDIVGATHGSVDVSGEDVGPAGTDGGMGEMLELLERVVAQRLRELPEGSYVTRLHERGLGYMAQKVVEEAGESVVAALEGKDEELLEEAADLLFHLTVLLQERRLGLQGVLAVLRARHESGPQR